MRSGRWQAGVACAGFAACILLLCVAGRAAAACNVGFASHGNHYHASECWNHVLAELGELQQQDQQLEASQLSGLSALATTVERVGGEAAKLRWWLRYMNAAAVTSWLLCAGAVVFAVLNRRVLLAPWNAGLGYLGAPAFEVRPRRQVRPQLSALPPPPTSIAANPGARSTTETEEPESQKNGDDATSTSSASIATPAPAMPQPVVTYKAVELSLMTATAGEPLGYANVREGQLVVRGPDWAEGADDGGPGHLGVVQAVSSPAVGQQEVKVRWLKTGVETAAQLRGGKPGGRKFCVAVVDVAS
ncbi:hypothetical protein HYH02_009454 [Chlamydomonas schloesseri]|uniref:MIB/HERC2 domain-containing protein n=1 Tax=Chlamydomonas schloesseri TaxID=2026947 RepID=A0A835W9F5_9CHLO|nr:hypothetical protein HYH02_009454 [Chlamydomonas schloesseri]|eukprot:KAG2443039.1 hypothetical protein HYH02_009454 [Chlamydomonas schloesseri]